MNSFYSIKERFYNSNWLIIALRSVQRVLVTGGAGFIGSHIVDELLKRGFETFVIDDFSSGKLYNLKNNLLNPRLHVLPGDISQIHNIMKDIEEIDVVFHEAAIASVTESVRNPEKVFYSNVRSTMKVIDFCLNSGVKKIIFASSSAVYGDLSNDVLNEDLACKPTSPYGASKLSVENYLHSYWKTYGLKCVSLRYFNVYGPRQSNNEYSGVITIFIDRLINNQSPIIYGDGSQTRDFVNIQDVVYANMLSMESNNAVGEIFNVGTGIPTSILDLVQIARNTVGKDEINPTFTDARAGDILQSLSDISRARNLLAYNPKINLQDGLESFVRAYSSSSLISA
ncbi:UDP-glucose 4-epimerase [Candidatus Nitrosocosmicus oleophilus]|uniref:UDP-glucose 4-epimerase n=1 Tax=Candidatus Nitrosocosmicus oleophilus TaxID=1353260 RepID=A0A654LZ89_9ARCH|nr:SDR family NAD(P)-dependent oxidoreductase [Candidatus Nitrosocosmicus oleophilus]ALI36768.1 UDP-glucose 4-epimerase [Candidatus Nitrosocosmicus oleophilus]